MIRFLPFLLVGCIAAEATEVSQVRSPWYIKTTTPESGGEIWGAYRLGGCESTSSDDCPMDGEVIEWASSNNYFTCRAYVNESGRNIYELGFKAGPSNWPTNWPTSVTCYKAGTGDWAGDYVESTVPIDWAPDTNGQGTPYDTAISLTAGYTFTVDRNAAGISEATEYGHFALPAGTYTTISNQTCKKSNGTNWSGVRVWSRDNGSGVVPDRLEIKIGSAAVAHTGGYCTISRNGSNVNIPVSVVRE